MQKLNFQKITVKKSKMIPNKIHPVAHLLRYSLSFITRRTSNQSYRPTMFRDCIKGCHSCHKLVKNQYNIVDLICDECDRRG